MMKFKNTTIQSSAELAKKWTEIEALAMKEKMRMYRTFGMETFHFHQSAQSLTITEIDLCRKILHAAICLPAFPARFTTYFQKVGLDWMMRIQGHEPQVLQKKAGKVIVEGGAIGIADPAHYVCERGEATALLENMRNKDAFLFRTGGDGLFHVQLREVSGIEPYVSVKEFKMVRRCIAKTAVIRCESGMVAIDAMESYRAAHAEKAVSLKVDPGFYKVNVFLVQFPAGGDQAFYAVLCKTEENCQDGVRAEIDRLEY